MFNHLNLLFYGNRQGKNKKDNLCSCAPCYNFVAVNHNYSLKLNAYENKKNQELQEFG